MFQLALQKGDPLPEGDREKPLSFSEIVRREWTWTCCFAQRWLWRAIGLLFWLIPPLAVVYGFVWALSKNGVYDSVESVPVKYVGLVLGCAEKVGPDDNAFFLSRVEAAHALLQAGKVQYLLVSGHPDRDGCNEPLAMKAALVSRGVSPDKIYCDFGGGRTLDSVVRARKVFGQRDMTIVSQEFHNERALYMARRRGLPDSVALNAQNVDREWMNRAYLKEVVARALAVIEVEAQQVDPAYPGEKVNIGPHWPPQDFPQTPQAQVAGAAAPQEEAVAP